MPRVFARLCLSGGLAPIYLLGLMKFLAAGLGRVLGGFSAEKKQNCSGQDCHTDNKFNHAHSITPFRGLWIQPPLPLWQQARLNYKSCLLQFQRRVNFFTVKKINRSKIFERSFFICGNVQSRGVKLRSVGTRRGEYVISLPPKSSAKIIGR